MTTIIQNVLYCNCSLLCCITSGLLYNYTVHSVSCSISLYDSMCCSVIKLYDVVLYYVLKILLQVMTIVNSNRLSWIIMLHPNPASYALPMAALRIQTGFHLASAPKALFQRSLDWKVWPPLLVDARCFVLLYWCVLMLWIISVSFAMKDCHIFLYRFNIDHIKTRVNQHKQSLADCCLYLFVLLLISSLVLWWFLAGHVPSSG